MSKSSLRISVLIVDDEAPARKLLRFLLEKEPDIDVIGEALDGAQAISLVKSLSPDLVLLDIQMPKIDGFEVISRLGPSCPHIVFVTAYHDYAVKAFEVHALDYILKPPVPARFRAAIDRARQTIRNDRKGVQRARLTQLLKDIEQSGEAQTASSGVGTRYLDRLTVRDRGGIHVLSIDKIEWIEAADHLAFSYIHNSRHLIDRSLAEIEREVDPRQFTRIRRNVIINLSHLASVRAGRFGSLVVTLRSGREFSTSRFLPGEKRRQLIMSCQLAAK